MRIRDWRSDVCSSDLGKGTTDQPDVYVFRVAQNLLVDRVRKLMVRQRYREAALTEPERDLDVLDPHSIAASREEMAAFLSALTTLPERTRTMFILYRQIGRASCRERVCQYV